MGMATALSISCTSSLSISWSTLGQRTRGTLQGVSRMGAIEGSRFKETGNPEYLPRSVLKTSANSRNKSEKWSDATVCMPVTAKPNTSNNSSPKREGSAPTTTILRQSLKSLYWAWNSPQPKMGCFLLQNITEVMQNKSPRKAVGYSIPTVFSHTIKLVCRILYNC